MSNLPIGKCSVRMEGLRLRVGGPAGVEGDFPISGTPSDNGAADSSEGHAFDLSRYLLFRDWP